MCLLSLHVNEPTDHPVACPRCDSNNFKRNGHAAGVQLYFCRCCNRTFNARTGTRLARLRRRDQCQRFLQQMMTTCRSLRHDAALLGVSAATVWRWRHQELAKAVQRQNVEAPSLRGVVVLDSFTLAKERSTWGRDWNVCWKRRHIDIPVRTTPGACQVTVLFAVELKRTAGGKQSNWEPVPRKTTCLVIQDTPNPWALGQALSRRLVPGSWAQTPRGRVEVLPTERSFQGNEDFPSNHRLKFRLGKALKPKDCWPARALRGAFNRWMTRFQGVAVTYLERYVAWFNVLSALNGAERNEGLSPEFLCSDQSR